MNAVFPMPGRDRTTPTLPVPRPPWIERSNTRRGLRSWTFLTTMLGTSYLLRLLIRAPDAALVLLDQLGRGLRGDRRVARELHRELGLPLARRAQLGRVAEHLAERDLGVDPGEALFFRRSDDHAAALHARPVDLALELRG